MFITELRNYSYDDDEDSAREASAMMQKEKDGPVEIPKLNEVQMLLVSGLLYGYSLREGRWGNNTPSLAPHTPRLRSKGAFAVDNVAPIEWNRYNARPHPLKSLISPLN
jgi:hypothetical protein